MLRGVFEGWSFPLIASLSLRIPQVLGFLSIEQDSSGLKMATSGGVD